MTNVSNPYRPLISVLTGGRRATPPIWLMRQAGRYLPEYRALRKEAGGFLDLCFTPELAEEVTLQPIRRFGFDAAILFSDILVIPLALGQKVEFREGVGPVLDPIRASGQLSSLRPDALGEVLAPVYETLRRLRGSLPDETTLIGFAGAPWTVATYMVEGGTSRDHAWTKAWAYKDPETFQRLIDLIANATVEHLSLQVEAGAEVLQIFDTWAGALSYRAMRRWSLDPISSIVRQLKNRFPHVPIIVFPRGVGEAASDFASVPGIDALSLDSSVSPRLGRLLQEDVVIQGNLDPHVLVTGGEIMRSEVRSILEDLGGGPFVFNLGHGILPSTPPDHVAELVALVREGRN